MCMNVRYQQQYECIACQSSLSATMTIVARQKQRGGIMKDSASLCQQPVLSYKRFRSRYEIAIILKMFSLRLLMPVTTFQSYNYF